MHAVIQTIESMVMALAVAAFAHFGVALKECRCPKAAVAPRAISYVRPATPRTIGRASPPLAKDARPV